MDESSAGEPGISAAGQAGRKSKLRFGGKYNDEVKRNSRNDEQRKL